MKDRSSWFKTIAYKGYKLGKSASPDWESLYHGFDRIEMPPNFGVNLQLNIELIRESCSGLSFIMNRIQSIQSGCSIIS